MFRNADVCPHLAPAESCRADEERADDSAWSRLQDVRQVHVTWDAHDLYLGVDATLCYLKDEQPCVLHESDFAQDSPYNTRANPGLPPTPIANVSRKSLEAALHPAAGSDFYYVLDPDVDPSGHRHLFTASASEFEAAKARCQAAGLGCD